MGTSLFRGVDPNGEIRTVSVTTQGEVRVAGISGGPGSEPGVQYDEGEQDVTITGTAVMWEGDNNTLQPVSEDTPLPVQIEGLIAAIQALEGQVQALEGQVQALNEALPLPEGAASNATLVQVRDRFPSELVSGRFKTISLIDAGENFIGAVGGKTVITFAEFTRPNDTIAYTAKDGVSNSTGAPTPLNFPTCARVLGGTGLVISARMVKTGTSATNASFRLWLYAEDPGNTPADNAPFNITYAARMTRRYYIDFDFSAADTLAVGSDCITCIGTLPTNQIAFKATATSLFGILQAKAAYTPASGEKFYLELAILQD